MMVPRKVAAKSPINVRVRFDDKQDVARELRKIPLILKNSIQRTMAKQALLLARSIRRGIRTQAPAGQPFLPLAESTILMKGSSKALIDTGDLIASITSKNLVLARRSIARFVGVHRTALGKKEGRNLANIAEIHEFGTKPYNIPVTRRMQRWWDAMVAKGVFQAPLDPRQMWIKHPGIPARPFLRPPFEEWKKGIDERMQAGIQQELQAKINRQMLRNRKG